jgi:hypothetical protein
VSSRGPAGKEEEAAHRRGYDQLDQQMLLLDDRPDSQAPVAALSIPWRIAGDFDFTHQDESLDVIIDVAARICAPGRCGETISSACTMIALSRPVRAGPREVVTLAHAGIGRHLIDSGFVTLCYARVDLIRRRLGLVDCGHTGSSREAG